MFFVVLELWLRFKVEFESVGDKYFFRGLVGGFIFELFLV